MSSPSASSTEFEARRTLLFAVATGLVVMNIYLPQPLTALIGVSLHLPAAALGTIVTVTQLGYAAGLVLLVPLGDSLENRRLIGTTLLGAALGSAVMALAGSGAVFFLGAFVMGLCSVAAQMLIPLAAHLAPDASRGRVVGNVMSGLMTGILLARPLASALAALLGWRGVFGIFAGVTLLLAVVLRGTLPRRQPPPGLGFAAALRSLGTLLRTTPVLQRRSTYQAALFGCFSLFWTAVPLVLAGAPFHLTQRGIGLFALAGAGGAVVAPIAGRMADRGWIHAGTGICLALVAASFGLGRWGVRAGSIGWLVAAALLLDLGATANLVFSQRAIFALPAGIRSRLNGLFIALFFLGGAAGSALAGLAFARAAWPGITTVGLAFSALAAAAYATERPASVTADT